MTTAQEILDVLREKLWTDGAHAWLYEVANATGGRANRYADAVVCSCWPSRGLWLAGIEAKVSRSDWVRERDDPHKSVAVQRFCRYWWLVTTPGIAKPEEIPELWGHIEVNGKHKILKHAPELKPEAPTMDIVASIARNAAKNIDLAVNHRANALITRERDLLRDERNKLNELNRELGSSSNVLESYKKLRENCNKFKAETGLDITSDWSLTSSVETIRLADKLTGFEGIGYMRKRLGELSDLLASLDVKPEAAQ